MMHILPLLLFSTPTPTQDFFQDLKINTHVKIYDEILTKMKSYCDMIYEDGMFYKLKNRYFPLLKMEKYL